MNTLFEGCDSIIDAKNYSSLLCRLYPENKETIESYRDSFAYNDNIDLSSKLYAITSLANTSTKKDAEILFDTFKTKTTDKILVRVMRKMVTSKRDIKRNIDNRIVKKCPHCGISTKLNKNETYVICGYTSSKRGYNMKGCGNDWCFKCNKRLCKNWNTHTLSVESNRKHDSECCRIDAEDKGLEYDVEYCHCLDNVHIDLDITSYVLD